MSMLWKANNRIEDLNLVHKSISSYGNGLMIKVLSEHTIISEFNSHRIPHNSDRSCAKVSKLLCLYNL